MSLSLQCNYNAKTSKHSNRMHTVPLCCLYIIQWPLDVTSKVIWGQDLYRGEEVWAGTLHGEGRENCTVRSNTLWVMVTWGPPIDGMMVRHN